MMTSTGVWHAARAAARAVCAAGTDSTWTDAEGQSPVALGDDEEEGEEEEDDNEDGADEAEDEDEG